MGQDIEIIRKRALYRSKNRGCRETDILLGRFAEEELGKLSSEELRLFELFLDEYDGDVYKWLTGTMEMPDEYRDSIGKKIYDYCHARAASGKG